MNKSTFINSVLTVIIAVFVSTMWFTILKIQPPEFGELNFHNAIMITLTALCAILAALTILIAIVGYISIERFRTEANKITSDVKLAKSDLDEMMKHIENTIPNARTGNKSRFPNRNQRDGLNTQQ